MRRILFLASRATTSPAFRLEDLPGAGRLDLVCRVVGAAFGLSHGLRKDVRLDLLLRGPPDPPRAVRLDGAALRSLNPDERSTAALLQKALAVRPTGTYWQPSTPGIAVARADLADLLDGPVVLLDEAGTDVRTTELPADAVYALGDDRGFTDADLATLRAKAVATVRLGPRSLQADPCVTLLHNELDRREAAADTP